MEPSNQDHSRYNQEVLTALNTALQLVTEKNQASQALTILEPYANLSEENPHFQKLHTQLGWVHYKLASNDTAEGRAHFSKALDSANSAYIKGGDNSSSLACIATILAQSTEHRDDQQLFTLTDKITLLENPRILNAVVIRGMKGEISPDFSQNIDSLVKTLYSNPEVFDKPDLVYGHILVNYGKTFLNQRDQPTKGLEVLQSAVAIYGIENTSAYPHIGGAFYWMSCCALAKGDSGALMAYQTASAAFKALASGDGYQNDEKYTKSLESISSIRALMKKSGLGFLKSNS